MQLVRRLLSSKRVQTGRNQKIRGLSTAELVGIIVIVGILGALGGTYIGSLVNSANSSAFNQNINSLNTETAAMLASGVPFVASGAGADTVTSVDAAAVTSGADIITQLNTGLSFKDSTGNTVLFKLNPPIATPASYVETTSVDGNGNVSAITWSKAAGATAP